MLKTCRVCVSRPCACVDKTKLSVVINQLTKRNQLFMWISVVI